VLYLQAVAKPIAEQALTAWSTALDVNVLTPTTVGTRAKFSYLETRFTLPKQWPGQRLFVIAPGEELHLLVINNAVVMVPPSMDRLDISHLVHRDGDNVIRWLPGRSIGGWPAFAAMDAVADRTVPGLTLGWWP